MGQRSLTRREVLRGATGAAAALTLAGRLDVEGLGAAGAEAAAGAAVGGWREPDYWAFADPIAAWMDGRWDAGDGSYRIGRGGETAINAAMLTIHAVAALRGHQGAPRDDGRARALARRLCASPPWSERAAPSWPDKMFHRHGWVTDVQHLDAAGMEKSVDPKVAEGLAAAYRARDVIGLDAADVAVMRDRVRRCAYDPFFRYPYVRLNQINWNSEMFAHLATMTGDTALLRRDYYLHVRRFCAGVRTPWGRGNAPNLQAGYRFGYLTTRPPSNRYNLDSAEYANITVHFLLWYERARRAGMPPLPKADEDLLKAWVERIVMGYWTHSGFLNWDSGLGLGRWQIGKTFAFAQQGLLALALATNFHSRPEFGGWAKYFLDRGLRLYQQWAADEHDVLAPAWLNGIRSFRGGAESDRILFAVRTAANAVRAIDLGIADRDAIEPPPIYAYDPDIGRVAVSTPAYSAALLGVNQGAVRYGGADPVRLYDADGRPVATIGGSPPAAFGVVVGDAGGHVLVSTQRARPRASLARPPVRLTRAPRGTARRLVAHPRHAYAAPFRALDAEATTAHGDVRVRSQHRFRAGHVDSAWTVTSAGRRALTVDVRFPVWTRGGSIDAVLRDGRRVRVAGAGAAGGVALADVAWFHLQTTQRTGYVLVVARGARRVSRVEWVATAPQVDDRQPGPTLSLRVATRERVRRLVVEARIAPARDAAEAVAAARRLRG